MKIISSSQLCNGFSGKYCPTHCGNYPINKIDRKQLTRLMKTINKPNRKKNKIFYKNWQKKRNFFDSIKYVKQTIYFKLFGGKYEYFGWW